MAIDYFLKLSGIQGESTSTSHQGEIDVESWSWGVTAVRPAGGGGGGGGAAGRVQPRDLVFSARTSRATPPLLLACATGRHLPEAVLTGVRAGSAQQEFLRYRLTDVQVTSFETGASEATAGGGPTDQVALAFRTLEVEYRLFTASGTTGPPVTAGFDFRTNTPL